MDGVPLNEPGGFINLANISLDNVDRIEVVRGPASVLYGSDAVSGVVQIFSRQGVTAPASAATARHAELYGAAGSDRTRDAAILLSSSGTRASYSAGIASYRSDGIYDLNNHNENHSYSGSLRFTVDPRFSLRASARLTDGQYNFPTSFYGAPLDSNSYNSERRLSTGVGFTSNLSPNIDANVDLGYTRQSNIAADPEDGGTPFPFEARGTTQRRTANAIVNFRGLPGTVLTGGVEYSSQASASDGGETPSENPLLKRWSRAVFAQALRRTAGNADAVLGMRVDDNQRFGTFVTWRGAASAQVVRGLRLRGAVGSGFREPQFLEISGGGFARPNPELQPEHSLSGEVGLQKTFASERVQLSLTHFRQTFRDLIRYNSLEDDPDYFNQYQNHEKAIANGWELEAQARVATVVSLSVAFTALQTRLEGTGADAGLPLPRRPSRYGSASVAWDLLPNLLVDGTATYVGRRNDTRFFADFSSQRERLGGYGKLDLSARYRLPPGQFSSNPLELTARIDNALDRGYEAVAGFETPGRRFLLGLRLLMQY
jgi:vitamin B12 transporter